ncbi:TPA: hypothetical protein EYN98_18305 [Candidatus Poribacteria bacterium]|nr:hypothetical protein [Candidatus Poribacteria bacterium]HIB89740.1 hypothetical protein [Candidatus Poribacteria bacterium]HIO06038.1 hypothetical protein [Candidatus Poribacteria bacterium]HIO81939.1 hypothetical protein [Candidatus Poribacteria bacterium]
MMDGTEPTNKINLVHNKTSAVIDGLAKLRDVKAILCFGSHAMGTADKYSDFDLFVLCDPEIVALSERRSVLKNIEGFIEFQPKKALLGWNTQWCPQGESLRINNDRLEIVYNTTDWIEMVVRHVTKEGTISIPEQEFRPYTMLGLLENSIVLYDPKSFLSHLIANLYPYPPRLKETLISENLPILRDSLTELSDGINREFGSTFFHFFLGKLCDALYTVLFAFNEKYDPATKRAEEEYRQLRVLPPNFVERYTRLLEGPFDKNGKRWILRELKILVTEIEELVGAT